MPGWNLRIESYELFNISTATKNFIHTAAVPVLN
jgi:hypothetical protein